MPNKKRSIPQAKRNQTSKRPKPTFTSKLRMTTPVVAILLFAVVGTLMLIVGFASPGDNRATPKDDPARGLIYHGKKIATTGPCKGNVQEVEIINGQKHDICTIIDPGPPGIDIRERAKRIDEDAKRTAEKDAQFPPVESDAPPLSEADQIVTENNIRWRDSLSEVWGRNWPCVGTGTDGSRVRLLYVYPAGKTSRLETYRSYFESIAKRTNATFYNSSTNVSKPKQIRFATNDKCGLRNAAIAISGTMDYTNIRDSLIAKGYNESNRRYLVHVDYGGRSGETNPSCGIAQRSTDARPTLDNQNNGGLNGSVRFAMAWYPCWNYAEPHELMHSLGAVLNEATNKTAGGHCTDQNDIMCYDDDGTGPVVMRNVCTANAHIWKFDCGRNDYFDASKPTTGFLSKYWNTANSNFLTQ